jgi:hypothetical protein
MSDPLKNYKSRYDDGPEMSDPLKNYKSRYDDEEPDEEYSTDSDFAAAAKRLFPPKKKGRPTNKQKEEREKQKAMKQNFQNMLKEPKTSFVFSDEEIAKLADQEFYNEGVKAAQENIFISPDEWQNAPTPFLKGYNSVLPFSERDDDDLEVTMRQPSKRRGRPRKQPEKYKP